MGTIKTAGFLLWLLATGVTALPPTSDECGPVTPANATLATAGDSAPTGASAPAQLNALFQAKGKRYFGAEVDFYYLNASYVPLNNTLLLPLIKDVFGQVTPENSMKWFWTEPARGCFNFTDTDQVVEYALANGKYVRGHNLLSPDQLPDWVSQIDNADTLTQVMQTHVTTLVTRYKGKMLHWDVVSDIFAEDGTLRDSVFSRLLGEDFVSIAFKAARAADPDAKLYINDHYLDDASWPKLAKGVVPYVNKWLAAGVPIDGIGTECHLNSTDPAVGVPQALKALAATNVSEIAITELDISGAPPEDYVTVMQGCLAEPKCVGITTWGVVDKWSWKPDQTPLLFDENFQPKPAYEALIKALS